MQFIYSDNIFTSFIYLFIPAIYNLILLYWVNLTSLFVCLFLSLSLPPPNQMCLLSRVHILNTCFSPALHLAHNLIPKCVSTHYPFSYKLCMKSLLSLSQRAVSNRLQSFVYCFCIVYIIFNYADWLLAHLESCV